MTDVTRLQSLRQSRIWLWLAFVIFVMSLMIGQVTCSTPDQQVEAQGTSIFGAAIAILLAAISDVPQRRAAFWALVVVAVLTALPGVAWVRRYAQREPHSFPRHVESGQDEHLRRIHQYYEPQVQIHEVDGATAPEG